jgi:hypothetical protein
VEDGVRELIDVFAAGMVGDYHESIYHNVVAASEHFSRSALAI